MKFIIDSKLAFARLSKLSGLVNATTIIPILECVLVTVYRDHVLFQVSDLETFGTAKIPVDASGNGVDSPHNVIGNFAVGFVPFLKFFKNADPLEQTVVTIKEKESQIILKNGGFEAEMKLDNPGNFPKDYSLDADMESIGFEQKQFIPYLKNVLKFVSNDDLRPAMTGVYFHKKGKAQMMAATDAHRLYFKEIAAVNKDTITADKIIPAKPLRILADLPSSDKVLMKTDKFKMQITFGSFVLHTRLIDARFPDYSVVIPVLEHGFYLKRKQLKAYLKMAEPFTNKATGQLKFEVTKDSMKITGQDADFSIGCLCSLPVYNATGIEPFDTAFNVRFLLQALECSTDENVHIKTSMVSTKASIFDECILIMPLMLN
jgi:DNA polymerase-3 subunit beta